MPFVELAYSSILHAPFRSDSLTRSCICHAQEKWLVVDLFEILILKLLSVYAFASSTIARCEVSALDHKLLNDAMETRSLVVQWLSLCSCAFLAGAKRTEVFGGFGYD